MDKVVLIGCGGAGKSTLAIQLAEKTNLPLFHLDRLFWKAGWQEVDKETFIQKQAAILETDKWIIDGNYGGTMEKRLEQADTIIFLDFSTITCLVGIFSRYLRYRKTSRPDMTEGNAERLDYIFFKYVLFYNRTRRPKILKDLDTLPSNKEIHILRSRKEVAQFLEKF